MRVLAHGIEIELPVIKFGNTPFDENAFIHSLKTIWDNKQYQHSTYTYANNPLEIISPQGNASHMVGFDSVYATLELSTGPYKNLAELKRASSNLYNDVLHCIEAQGANIINFSEMPHQSITTESYKKIALESPYFSYLTKYRKLSYNELADSKSQISPCTSIEPKNALNALNLILKLSPIFIALYANSPYESCRDTNCAENRMNLWEKVFKTSIFDSDKYITHSPKEFFSSLHHYITCLYGKFPCYAISKHKHIPYKKNEDLFILKESPNMLNFLRADSWDAYSIVDGKQHVISPEVADFLQQQFTYFIDARLRFDFDYKSISKDEIIKAYDKGPEFFNDFFIDIATQTYIENRVPGSQCPDASLANSQACVKQSVHIALPALQSGILQNSAAIEHYLNEINFAKNHTYFRTLAIEKGLHGQFEGTYLIDIIQKIVDMAESALNDDEKPMLSYIKHILDKKQNAADKALGIIKSQKDPNNIDWEYICMLRKALQI